MVLQLIFLLNSLTNFDIWAMVVHFSETKTGFGCEILSSSSKIIFEVFPGQKFVSKLSFVKSFL